MPVTEVLADDVVLRGARRERVLAAMEAANVDVLVVGREANARYISGAPRLWTAGSRAFGPGCVIVGSTGAVHLLSTWDEGIPDDIPHDNLYGISFNSATFLEVLRAVEGASTVATVATDALTPASAKLLPAAFPSAEIVDGEQLMRRARRVKLSAEVDLIRQSVRASERALAATEATLAPGVTERELTAVFMEAMALAGVTTPAGQDVAWITSRGHPWRRTGRDSAAVAGDLVVLGGGVVAGGYTGELARTRCVGDVTPDQRDLWQRCDDLRGRLLAACRAGATASTLLDAYVTAGVETPPVPVARGLGLGFDVPLVTVGLERTATDQILEAGMVFALTALVWQEGVGAVCCQEPVHLTDSGPELLASYPTADWSPSP